MKPRKTGFICWNAVNKLSRSFLLICWYFVINDTAKYVYNKVNLLVPSTSLSMCFIVYVYQHSAWFCQKKKPISNVTGVSWLHKKGLGPSLNQHTCKFPLPKEYSGPSKWNWMSFGKRLLINHLPLTAFLNTNFEQELTHYKNNIHVERKT